MGARAVLIAVVCLASSAAGPQSRDLPATLLLQVALDRAGISPGLIDGRAGARTRDALALLQRAHGLEATGVLDAASETALGMASRASTTAYTLTPDDLAGPFVQIPDDLMAQGDLPALGYVSAQERVAERFHTDTETLQRLNPHARFVEGESIQVPDVEPMAAPAKTARRLEAGVHASMVGAIVVSIDPPHAVVVSTDQTLLFAAPVTSGSEHDPLPIGEWKVVDVFLNPVFHYNPALFWDADPSHAKTVIRPGPNSPVGVAWIDIDREHYGLHGTPEPRTVGHTSSHGCVRLTNWDVVRLLDYIGPGTRILFDEHPPEIKPSAR